LAHALAIALEVIRVPALRRRQVELEIAIAAMRLEKELEAGALPEFVRAALACERRRDERLRSLDPPAGPQPAGIRADDARLDFRNSRGGMIGMRHELMRLHEVPCVLRARAARGSAMSKYQSDLLRLLDERGYIHQLTDPEGLDALARRQVVPGYIGFDATAPSL